MSFQDYLKQHIPLSTAMQVRVETCDAETMVLSAPLAANHNDKGTGFAGSIASLASLAGWGLCMRWAEREVGTPLVAIAHADIQYRKPVTGNFRARATLPGDDALRAFHRRFAEKGRARLTVRIEVSDDQGLAAEQVAEYVVWR